MTRQMLDQGVDHLWLDATGLESFDERFPTISAALRRVGLDPSTDWLPIAPAAHYFCGGVVTDLDGATSLPGLWAAGEAACSGVHGANRLASNSLLEGMVFGARVVEAIEGGRTSPAATGAMRSVLDADDPGHGLGWSVGDPSSIGGLRAADWAPSRRVLGSADEADATSEITPLDAPTGLRDVQRAMTEGAGVLRDAASLAATSSVVERVARQLPAARDGSRLLRAGQPGRGGARPAGRGDHPDREPRRAHAGRSSRHRPGVSPTGDPAGHRGGRRSRWTGRRDERARAAAPRRRRGRRPGRWPRTSTPLGDLTSALVPPDLEATADFVVRAAGVVAGIACATETFEQVDRSVTVSWTCADGAIVDAGTTIGTVVRPAGVDPHRERTALNFLGHLSGIATLTRRFVVVAAAAGATRIWDTRKTTPGLRSLEKAAVRAGGGANHRGNLSDWVLLKDNHLSVLGIAGAVAAARERWPGRTVHVECDRLDQLHEALEAGADAILLDNMAPDEVRAAVVAADEHAAATGGRRPLLEISGGITLETVTRYVALGADMISVGGLTNSAPVLDIGLDIAPRS